MVGTNVSSADDVDFPPPGLGLVTVTVYDPATVWLLGGSCAVTCEEDTKEVVSGVLFKLTSQPETNPSPLTVNVAGVLVIATAVGFTETTLGTGLVTDTVAEPDSVESAWLVAVTVTEAGLGTVAGPVYSPEEEIVPSVLFPPATSFTLQVTAEL
jgi:hypothetical protein